MTALSKLNYYNAKYSSFSIIEISDNLKANHPIVCVGTRETESGSKGHAWVVDGGWTEYYTCPGVDGSTYKTYCTYFHCIWGWGGTANGYFFFKQNSLGGTPKYPDDEYSGSGNVYTNLSTISRIYK